MDDPQNAPVQLDMSTFQPIKPVAAPEQTPDTGAELDMTTFKPLPQVRQPRAEQSWVEKHIWNAKDTATVGRMIPESLVEAPSSNIAHAVQAAAGIVSMPVLPGLNKAIVEPFEKMSAYVGEKGADLGAGVVDFAVPKSVQEAHPLVFGIERGMARGIGGFAGSMLGDLRQWPLLGSGEVAPVFSKLMSGGFGVMMGYQTIMGIKNLSDNWDNMTPEQRSEEMTRLGISTYFTKAATEYAFKSALAPEHVMAQAEKPAVPTQTVGGREVPVLPQNKFARMMLQRQPEMAKQFLRERTAPAIAQGVAGTIQKSASIPGEHPATTEDPYGLKSMTKAKEADYQTPVQRIDQVANNAFSEAQMEREQARGNFTKEGKQAYADASKKIDDLWETHRAQLEEEGMDVDEAKKSWGQARALETVERALRKTTEISADPARPYDLKMGKVLGNTVRALLQHDDAPLQKLFGSKYAEAKPALEQFARVLNEQSALAAGKQTPLDGILGYVARKVIYEAVGGTTGWALGGPAGGVVGAAAPLVYDKMANAVARRYVGKLLTTPKATELMTNALKLGADPNLVGEQLKTVIHNSDPSWVDRTAQYLAHLWHDESGTLTVGTPEGAIKDTDLFLKAKAELGSKATTSEIAQRAQEMKDAAYQGPERRTGRRAPMSAKELEDAIAQRAPIQTPFDVTEGAMDTIKRDLAMPKAPGEMNVTPLSERPEKTILSAKLGDRAIGQMSLTPMPELGEGAAEVSTSQIKSAFQGKGYGSDMYKQAIDYAREKGLQTLYSDDQVSTKADNVWQSLERKGIAAWDDASGRYKIDLTQEAPAMPKPLGDIEHPRELLESPTASPFKILDQEDTPAAERVNPEPETPRPIDRARIQGGAKGEPTPTYHEAAKTDGNPWVRRSADPVNDAAQTNEKRTLLVQFSSDLLHKAGLKDAASEYYDKLYSGSREGYARMKDFWEIPQWIGFASHFLPDADVYVVRDMEAAKAFLNDAKYGHVGFSALDVNKGFIKELAQSYDGQFDVGGYIKPEELKDVANIRWHDSMESFAKEHGVAYKNGVDYRHFQGSDVIPRLSLSDGCLHKCAFCIVTKDIKMTPDATIRQQADAIGKMGSKLVYVNDKTFGQAKNHTMLPELYEQIKAQNPNFKGFVVQTTAAQLGKIPADFLSKSGIKFVELGIESYNDPILKALHKPATEHLIDVAVDKLRQNKIALIPNILIGLPGEDAASYGRTLDFLKRNEDIISHANIYNLALYKDSELGQKLTTASEADFNENVLEKSFHENPEIHKTFAGELYGIGQKLLSNVQSEIFPPEGGPRSGNSDAAIAQEHNANGGSSLLAAGKVEDGFAVGIHKDLEHILPKPTVTAEDVAAYRNRPDVQAALKANSGAFIGTWADGDKTYMDTSIHVPDLETAKRIGVENKQIAIFDVKNKESIPLAQEPTGGQRVGQRNPVAAGSPRTNNPDASVGMKEVEQAAEKRPAYMKSLADRVSKYDSFNPPAPEGAAEEFSPEKAEAEANPKDVVKSFVQHAVDNIVHMYNQIPEKIREQSRQWYPGANKLTADWAKEYGLTHEQAAGVTAVLSPQNPWDNNISLAKRAMDIYKNKQDYNWDVEMNKKAAELYGQSKAIAQFTDMVRGSKLGELTDPDPEVAQAMKAMWLRIYDEAHNPRDFEMHAPDGTPRGLSRTVNGAPSQAAWFSLEPIMKAISIMDDGSMDNIHQNLGMAHKVRNFYNNIINPWSKSGDVTIDTQAVGVAHMSPLSLNSPEVIDNFKSPENAELGLRGTYPLYAEAYRQAAAKLGVLPRELQSATWDAIRPLFGDKNPDIIKAVRDIWKEHKNGDITAEQARKRIIEAAGGIKEPEWMAAARPHAEAAPAGNAPAVSATRVPEGHTAEAERGAGERTAAPVPSAGERALRAVAKGVK